MVGIRFLRLFKVFEEIGAIRHLVLHFCKGCADKNQVLVLDRKITGAGYFFLGSQIPADYHIGVRCAGFGCAVGIAGAGDNIFFSDLCTVTEHIILITAVAGCVPT